jgi:dipeptidyl aminopeptidase/acylaminoacyl peptidase
VNAGIIDPERVGISGWSYGGYLSYLAVARDSTFHFQAAMCGAGLSDWDHTIMTSSGWRSAIEIAGQGPWIGGIDDKHNRQGSALWQMKDVRTPVLILHGEDDDIVPIAQALAFHHGCEHYGSPCEMVIYPREGHGIWPPLERAHFIDMLERMKRFFDKHLGMTG